MPQSITLDLPSAQQAPFPNGTEVTDDAFPGVRANILTGGMEQSEVINDGGIIRTRPNAYLHDKDGTAAAAPAVAAKFGNSYRSNTLSRGQHKDRINAAWSKGEDAYIETGKYLLEAKAELEREAFKVLARQELHFDPATGRKFMRVAEKPILSAPGHKIPRSWTIRYELSKLDDDVLEAAIDDGRVHPGMTRKDAIAIRRPPKPKEDEGQGDDQAPQESKVAVFRKMWGTLSESEQDEFVQSEKIVRLLKAMSDTQREDLFERFIGQQIANASSLAAPANSKKLLVNLTGNLQAGLSHPDPAIRAKAIDTMKRRIEASGHTHKNFVIALVKKPRSK
jgi:hypothetical protein